MKSNMIQILIINGKNAASINPSHSYEINDHSHYEFTGIPTGLQTC